MLTARSRAASSARAAPKQQARVVVARAALSDARVSAAIMALTASVLTFSGQALATDNAPPPAPSAPQPMSISFARVDASVTEKLRQRDENLAWKCKGVNMYDCDGELAEEAEKRFDEMGKVIKSLGLANPINQ